MTASSSCMTARQPFDRDKRRVCEQLSLVTPFAVGKYRLVLRGGPFARCCSTKREFHSVGRPERCPLRVRACHQEPLVSLFSVCQVDVTPAGSICSKRNPAAVGRPAWRTRDARSRAHDPVFCTVGPNGTKQGGRVASPEKRDPISSRRPGRAFIAFALPWPSEGATLPPRDAL